MKNGEIGVLAYKKWTNDQNVMKYCQALTNEGARFWQDAQEAAGDLSAWLVQLRLVLSLHAWVRQALSTSQMGQ
jgi:hypothetical protein